jgi:competence protein ComEA
VPKHSLAFIENSVRKNIFTYISIALIFGCGLGFFVAGKRNVSSCNLNVDTLSGTEVSGESIVVDLSGAVSKPGVYKLLINSRVGDLLSMGGGVLGDVSKNWISKNLNLSKKLDDSAKVYIPFEWEIISQDNNEVIKTEIPTTGKSPDNSSKISNEDTGESSVGSDGKTNINTASSSELDNLPGIGPAYAEKIISSRPYKDSADFEARSGLWVSTIAGIKNLITF